MRILIEEHQYEAELVDPILKGISNLRDVEGKVSVNYVGYFYNPALEDCVFILPKVLMEDVEGKELVFGKYKPEEIINLEKQKLLEKEEHDFIYELSVWIYRAIVVYNDTVRENGIVYRQLVQQMSKGRLRKCNTFLDILLALQKFNRENQDFFFFILKNLHSGYNKINWTRTISHSTAFVQDGRPVYLDPVNKKRQVNFDEELLIIFFSILNYMREKYGFPVEINVNFPLITDSKFKNYMKGQGRARLLQIKYKYYSDKALYLWELCFAFFDQSKNINVETADKEYLLVKNFNIVFEAIIDELIGDKFTGDTVADRQLREMKEQRDGKRIDHIYRYRNLTDNTEGENIYYIGDSKYYKRNNKLGDESIYKQFTYARNLIQWNIDLFGNGYEQETKGHVKLRDDVTEGYNVIPNFFISAHQNELHPVDDIIPTNKERKMFDNKQFDNRLFDRDTFLVAHYDVNFLYVVSLYGRNNRSQKQAWKHKVRNEFREAIQSLLRDRYDFYAMTAHGDVDAEQYMRENFRMVLGKVFTPFEDKEYYSLALDKSEEYAEENEVLISTLRQNFDVVACPIGENPANILPKHEHITKHTVSTKFLTMHWLENYLEANILIGGYRDQQHLDWIMGKNDKGTLIYNVRLGRNVRGGQTDAQLMSNKVTFVILYHFGDENKNEYHVFRVHHTAHMTRERMIQAWYKNPSADKYFCYVFDEEVSLGNIDLPEVINRYKGVEHAPIYIKGNELIVYRK